MSARSDILRGIRKALGDTRVSGQSTAPPVVRDYRQSPVLEPEARLCLFIERLRDYSATVYRAAAIDEAIAEALRKRQKQGLLVPPGLPPEWLPAGFTFQPDNDLGYHEIDRAEGALTCCTTAIALTGTIILSHSGHEGRRALSLIPDYHLCVVRAKQVVETVPEGIRALAPFRLRPLTTISGPSATADIEMIRVKGVHGPRTLDVIILDG